MITADARLRVRYAETDQMGIVYYANYFVWMELGRVEWCRAAGIRYRDMEQEDGVLLAVAEASCRVLTAHWPVPLSTFLRTDRLAGERSAAVIFLRVGQGVATRRSRPRVTYSGVLSSSSAQRLTPNEDNGIMYFRLPGFAVFPV